MAALLSISLCSFWYLILSSFFFISFYTFFKRLILKRSLHCQIYSTLSPHFMCWKYFGECFMDKNLLHISLTKFNKLNKRRKRTFLITQFTFALYLAFIFSTSSVYYWRVVWSKPVSPQFCDSKSKKCVVNSMSWVAKNSVILYDHIYFSHGYIDCVLRVFCVLAE